MHMTRRVTPIYVFVSFSLSETCKTLRQTFFAFKKNYRLQDAEPNYVDNPLYWTREIDCTENQQQRYPRAVHSISNLYVDIWRLRGTYQTRLAYLRQGYVVITEPIVLVVQKDGTDIKYLADHHHLPWG